MNILLWVLQIFLGIYFIFTGVIHFIVPDGLPALMAWMYELDPALHWFSGIVEIIAGIGLILPGLLKIQPRLTVYAALLLVATMLGATFWHLTRGETSNIGMNILLGVLAAFVAYGRWKLSPLPDKNAPSEETAA